MKITVYFSLGDILECECVNDTRKFWRYVSKHCKHMSDYSLTERVIKVVKEYK